MKFTIQTTRGFKPKDYEMVQAIVGMWRKVGIEAEIEVYEIAKHYELRAADTAGAGRLLQLGQCDRRSDHLDGLCHVRPEPAFGVGQPGRHRRMIDPLWGETDEAKRIAGWKAVDKYIAEQRLCDPADPVCAADRSRQGVKVVPHKSGALLPH